MTDWGRKMAAGGLVLILLGAAALGTCLGRKWYKVLHRPEVQVVEIGE